MNFIKICLQIFKAEFHGSSMTLQLPLWLQRRNHKPSEGHLDSVDQQGGPIFRPCRSSRFAATNLKICLTPNGTVDRSATNFDRKIFEGKNFVCRRLFFRYLPGFTGIFFRTNFVRKNYEISNFLGMPCMLLKNFIRSAISRNFRGTRKFTPDVSAEFPCTRFDIRN
jgi:hypothetical protein